MVDDITSNQVSSVEYTVGVQLEMFPFLGVSVFGAKFHYNSFLVSNRRIS